MGNHWLRIRAASVIAVASASIIASSVLVSPPSFAANDSVPEPHLDGALSGETLMPATNCTPDAKLKMIQLGETSPNNQIMWMPATEPGNAAVKAVIHTQAGNAGAPDVGAFLWEFTTTRTVGEELRIHFEAAGVDGTIRNLDEMAWTRGMLAEMDPSISGARNCVSGSVWFYAKARETRLRGCLLSGRLHDVEPGRALVNAAAGSFNISLKLNGRGCWENRHY